MIRRLFFCVTIMATVLLASCSEDTSYGVSPSYELAFSTDTVRFDTVFSTVPSSTRYFWVYNKNAEGVRLKSVRLDGMNQRGFRVNVDGTFLGQETGYLVSDLLIPKGDSIRVFVEVTTPMQPVETPQKVEDKLLFALEGGMVQEMPLKAWSWNAEMKRDVVVSSDETISSTKPIIIYGGITVKQGATLTIGEGTTLYFHGGAGIEVEGRLIAKGAVLRGDRLDHMFDYLKFDEVPGQWKGIHFAAGSYDNEIIDCDIHAAHNGVLCEDADDSRLKLTMKRTKVHNCDGDAFACYESKVILENCQLSNASGYCAAIYGSVVDINYCTLAQFYVIGSGADGALLLANRWDYGDDGLPKRKHALNATIRNSIVTGYQDDVLQGAISKDTDFNYQFDHCLLRTPEVTGEDADKYTDVIFEDLKDKETTGMMNFVLVDYDLLKFDFHLSEVSKAIGAASGQMDIDLDHHIRKEIPDMGCYEYQEPQDTTEEETPPGEE